MYFFPHFRAFFLAVVDCFPAVVNLLVLGCSLSLGSELLGLDHLFISLGLEGWHLHLPHSFRGLGAQVLLEGASDGSS